MTSFSKAGIWIVIAAVLFLSLYELVDYTEVWQHDESLVLLGLLLLVIGMAMIALRVLCKAFVDLVQNLMARSTPDRLQTDFDTEFYLPVRPPPGFLPSLLADLRI